ncbi:hypothetical protein LOSG293_110470 [Secundilactobacillus oryzae JCM 18671]|uniref:Uncharacterized protein n=1 Tax=Secundilactobacillus oryzae JCM 18671 TaxID=1291743 RepID=A0A081BI63_9LACO|nr:hypothetical protein LOSG293_110470 [Secundilactobacillus oryzae JCM 18671]
MNNRWRRVMRLNGMSKNDRLAWNGLERAMTRVVKIGIPKTITKRETDTLIRILRDEGDRL